MTDTFDSRLHRKQLVKSENQWGKHHMTNRSPRWWERERMHRIATPPQIVSRLDQEQANAFAGALAALYNPDLDRQGDFEATLKVIRHVGAGRLYTQVVGQPRKRFILALLLRHGFEEEQVVSVHALIYG